MQVVHFREVGRLHALKSHIDMPCFFVRAKRSMPCGHESICDPTVIYHFLSISLKFSGLLSYLLNQRLVIGYGFVGFAVPVP